MSEVSEAIKQRLTSPVFGSFFISWLIINWQVPYVTFFVDKDKLSDSKLDFIVDYLNTTSHWCLITIPLLTTIIYIFAYPWLKYLIDLMMVKINSMFAVQVEKIQDKERTLQELNDRLNKENKTLSDEWRYMLSTKIISLNELFFGTWKVIFSDSMSEYKGCMFKANTFHTFDNNILFVILFKSSENDGRQIIVEITQRMDDGITGEYFLYLDKRDYIKLQSRSDFKSTIILSRQGTNFG